MLDILLLIAHLELVLYGISYRGYIAVGGEQLIVPFIAVIILIRQQRKH